MPDHLSLGEFLRLADPPVPGVGPLIHIEDHGSCFIAVRWDGERSIPWARLAQGDSEWYPMLLH